MKVIIGSPIYDRAWVIPHFFDAIENQTVELSNLGFLFECGPNDEETVNALFDWHAEHPEVICFDVNINHEVAHHEHVNGRRKWRAGRYRQMVKLRNSLLDRVRVYEPDRYFSLDTDIMLEPENTIERLYEVTEKKADAASPLMFMTPKGSKAPSVMTWLEPGVRAKRMRYPLGETFQADVIMAAKMMNKRAYNTLNYEYHRQGEDLGWCKQALEHDMKLFCVSDLYCPHIMSESDMERYLEDGDQRGVITQKSG